jgi:hypothetical protein
MWESYRKKGDESAFSGTSMSVRCYESHPVLKLGKGKLAGGSASHPIVKDADVYVSLQSGSTSGYSADPWDPTGHVVEVHFSISDMQSPSDVTRFKKMVTWLCNQLHDGKFVHVGCIGGHGRSGMLISAIVAEMQEKKDAIGWVRKHYCKKAVESKSQVQFLMKHYGVTEVEPTKGETKVWSKDREIGYVGSSWIAPSSSKQRLPFSRSETEWPKESSLPKPKQILPKGVTAKTKSFSPMASARSLWKPRKRKK